jgi:hypothetical protein
LKTAVVSLFDWSIFQIYSVAAEAKSSSIKERLLDPIHRSQQLSALVLVSILLCFLDCHLVPTTDLFAEMGDHGAVIVVTSKEQWDKILAENSDAAVVVSQELSCEVLSSLLMHVWVSSIEEKV